MARKLPQFSAVRAFEAAARHGSFARAAEELGVTATAISQHVRGLETWLGEPLFERDANGVRPTARAQDLLPEVGSLLDELANLLPLGESASGPVEITLSAPPALAEGWLLPRLADFQTACPGVLVHIHPADRPTLPDRDLRVDFAILDKPLHHDGLLCESLFEDGILPVCAPAYRDLLHLDEASGWEKAVLIHDTLWPDDWQTWGEGQQRITCDWKSGALYPNHWLALEAARNARGVLMAHVQLAAPSLVEGTLAGLGPAMPTGSTCYIARRRGHTGPAAIRFRAWLIEEVRKAEAIFHVNDVIRPAAPAE